MRIAEDVMRGEHSEGFPENGRRTGGLVDGYLQAE